MESKTKTEISKNRKENYIIVSREFNAPIAHVWCAYTESERLAFKNYQIRCMLKSL